MADLVGFASVVYDVVRGILAAWFDYASTPFSLPYIGRQPWFLLLQVGFWAVTIFYILAKAISLIAKLGRQ